MDKEKTGLRTWIEIDRKAIEHNYSIFCKLTPPETKICAVVKSNAYGFDLMQFSKELVRLGVDWLAVDSVVEGLRLRREGIDKPILVLGHTMPERISEAVEKGLSISVSNFEALDSVLSQSFEKKPKVHIKIDTGMTRQGFLDDDQKSLLAKLESVKEKIDFEGLFTHFADAKNPSFPDSTKKQIELFNKWRDVFQSNGFTFISHASASSGALLYPEAHFDMVRIGISLYGLWPSLEAKAYLQNRINLEPVMSWKAILSEVKSVPQGTKVGYGFTETLHRDTKVAVCPIGYWHGFSRKLSGIGSVLVNGQRAKVLGRVSMDMITFDVTDISDVSVGDEVVLLGRQKDGEITAYEMAGLDDTSWYETVTRINPLIKRIYK